MPAPGGGIASRQTEVASELESLVRSSSNLSDRVQILVERLSPVLRQEPEPGEKLADPHPPANTGIGQAVRQVTQELESIRRKVDTALGKLEL